MTAVDGGTNGAGEGFPDFGSRPVPESLLKGIAALERAAGDAVLTGPWYAELRAALRACSLAVEQGLDNIEAAGGLRERIHAAEPQLLPEIERLEADLGHALLEAWEAREAAERARAALARKLTALATELRAIVDREFELVHASLLSTGGEG